MGLRRRRLVSSGTVTGNPITRQPSVDRLLMETPVAADLVGRDFSFPGELIKRRDRNF
ncbi:MAG: hypothetical protein MZV63_25905 [Marinilabiliales bacterium]|nr:hypothetical protein [Marinilabiliales bacterium]